MRHGDTPAILRFSVSPPPQSAATFLASVATESSSGPHSLPWRLPQALDAVRMLRRHDGVMKFRQNWTAIHQDRESGEADTGKVASKLKLRIRIFEIFD